MKIIVFGATGTGKTTFGQLLAANLNAAFLDSDDYYWEKTNPPFEVKIPLAQRQASLKADFDMHDRVVVCGSLYTWSKFWNTAFDLGVFLSLPKAIRMKRLRNREIVRYGEALKTNEAIKKKSADFLEWAAAYETGTPDRHSMSRHLNWMKVLSCPIIKIDRDTTNQERLEIVLKAIENQT